jgi:limonene-1,2-epoxide hydrolase
MSDAVTLVRSYLASFSLDGEPHEVADRIARHVTDGFVNVHAAALGEGSVGRSEYRRRLPGFLRSFSGLRYDEVDVIGDGTRLAATYRIRAVYDGHPIDLAGVMVFDVVGDRIARRTDYWDALTFLHQTQRA